MLFWTPPPYPPRMSHDDKFHVRRVEIKSYNCAVSRTVQWGVSGVVFPTKRIRHAENAHPPPRRRPADRNDRAVRTDPPSRGRRQRPAGPALRLLPREGPASLRGAPQCNAREDERRP